MSIDLERFPWSDSANRMLTYVTKAGMINPMSENGYTKLWQRA